MAVNKSKVISELNLHNTGGKGWMISKSNIYACPKCHNADGSRLAVIFGEKVSSWKCVKCGYSLRLESLLWKIGKKNLITKFKEVKQTPTLEKRDLEFKLSNLDLNPLPVVLLPILYKRIFNSVYLKKRGANSKLFRNWNIGQTNFVNKLKGYIIFVITENSIPIGWVARCTKSKDEIEEYNKSVKEYNKTNEKKKYEILRWRNSESDFGKIVFGLDEINEYTKKIIVVEGLTSKMNLDCKLNTFDKENPVKVCCTFGKKITETQLTKILNKGVNLEEFVLFYDVSDAINELKKFSYYIDILFWGEIDIIYHQFKDENGNLLDAGDMNLEQINYCLTSGIKKPFYFYNNFIQKKKLKIS